MAVTASTTVGITSIAPGTVIATNNTGGYTTSTHTGYGYDPMRDTMFDVPMQDFRRMRYGEQQHYADKWERNRQYEERARREYAHYHGQAALDAKQKSFAAAAEPMSDQNWKSNTKLLLTEN